MIESKGQFITDTHGHMDNIKDKNTGEDNKNISLVSDYVSFLIDNPPIQFINKKAEKIASAIYLVTNLFSDSEPIKWKLRTLSTELVSFSVSLALKDTFANSRKVVLEQYRTKILELISILEIAYIAGILSEMNFAILKKELISLASSVSGVESHINDRGSSLPKGFFEQVKAPQSSPVKSQEINHVSAKPRVSIKDNIIKDIPKSSQHVQNENVDRKDSIISLFKDRSFITAKDVQSVMTNWSEKTIQRVLVGLVQKNVLKKEGIKRWSKYYLV